MGNRTTDKQLDDLGKSVNQWAYKQIKVYKQYRYYTIDHGERTVATGMTKKEAWRMMKALDEVLFFECGKRR